MVECHIFPKERPKFFFITITTGQKFKHLPWPVPQSEKPKANRQHKQRGETFLLSTEGMDCPQEQ